MRRFNSDNVSKDRWDVTKGDVFNAHGFLEMKE